ncbi:MAG: DOMON-like domain-containing protein [Rhodocyclaceae bacterium]
MTQAIHATLTAHPDNPAGLSQRIGVTLLLKPDGSLTLAYSIHGPLSFLRIPGPDRPAPPDALWQTTCCELFVGTGDDGYREFNFSPSGQWAVYDFGAYRKPLEIPLPCPAPTLESSKEANRLRLAATLPAAALPAGGILTCALAVIVEAHDGRRGYWALAHPPGKPDFHHPGGFTLCLDKTGMHA